MCEAEDTWGERQKEVSLEPGQELCGCGAVVEPDERRKCVRCGHAGCTHCLDRIHIDVAGWDDDWSCSGECKIEWLHCVALAAARTEQDLQNVIDESLEAARKKVSP